MIDFVLIISLMCVVLYGTLTVVDGWKDFDPSKPIPKPPSARLSFVAVLIIVVLVGRWIIAGYTPVAIFFGLLALAAMTWSWRIAVRAEAKHRDYLQRRTGS